MFILEAKLSPNTWDDIHIVSPQNEILSRHSNKDDAFAAKTKLQSFLSVRSENKFKKYPVPIRELD